jgi:hypothetical protein
MQKIELRDPAALKPHPLRARMPKRAKDSLAFKALTESIHTHGVNEPLAITADGHIIDGLERWHAAKDWQLEAVPCLVHADEDAPRLVVESLVARKQMTRGAAVYCVIPVLSEFFGRCETRRLENLTRGKNTGAEIPKSLRKGQCFSKTTELPSEEDERDIACQKLGINRETLRQARRLWLLLNEHGADFLRAEMGKQGLNLPGVAAVEFQTRQRLDIEPRLLAGELGVGHALSGMAGKASTQGKERVDNVNSVASFLARFRDVKLNSLPRAVEMALAEADLEEVEQMHTTAAEIEKLILAELEKRMRAEDSTPRDPNATSCGV